MVCLAPTMEEAEADLRAIAAVKGFGDEVVELMKMILIYGDPDTVGEKLLAAMNTGIDGLTINLAVNGHRTERIELLGQVASKAIAESGR
jgi:alkanesulfonate monooxygenase SsuD/methylene tetrahydromethanopterin reductase-like flavin-dependent oxidoreductase (luciferase family)